MIKKLLYKILSIQEQILKAQLSRTIGVKNNSKKKKHYFQGCLIELNSLAELEKKEFENKILAIIKQCEYSPEKILNYIKNRGYTVIFDTNAKSILNPIGKNEGFIYPTKGLKALYLTFSLGLKPSFSTKEMFVLPKGNINKYYFLYHFYNWFAYKNNITGLDRESQELLKKFLFSSQDTKELQLSEIYKLKDAINQDKAAIEFVIKLCTNIDGNQQAIEKIQTKGSALL